MGNEKSALRGLEVEDKAVEVTDYWMHYDANVHDSSLQRLSLFISEPSLHFTATFGRPSPLERAAKVDVFSTPLTFQYPPEAQKETSVYFSHFYLSRQARKMFEIQLTIFLYVSYSLCTVIVHCG